MLITINNIEFKTSKNVLSFDDIVRLSNKISLKLTISYSYRFGNSFCVRLLKQNEFLKLTNNMVITVWD